jgi:serine/threonine protein kinase
MAASDLIHGDIKPKNILVFTDSDGKPFPKLADFGFSLQETDIAIKLPVSKGWNAPEVTYAYPDMSFQQAQKADIYSCGLLALWLLAHVIRCGTHLASHPNGHSATPTRPLVGRDLQPAWYEIAADVHLHGPAASGVTKSLDEIANVTTPTCIKAMSAYFDSSLAVNPEERAQNCLQLLGVLQLPMSVRTMLPFGLEPNILNIGQSPFI